MSKEQKTKNTKFGELTYGEYANLMAALAQKDLLTMNEATVFFSIGRTRLQRIVNQPDVDFLIMSGKQKLISREKFRSYLLSGKTATIYRKEN
ncbi:TPA: excisionase [Streptococcus agalactiae]